jgi:chemotaxis signal transduction protein
LWLTTEDYVATEQNQLQLLRCYLEGDCYCLDTFDVAAIRRWEEVTVSGQEGPLVPGAIATVSHGKQDVPVYALHERMGLDTGGNPNGPVIIVKSSEHVYGIQVDRVARAVSVAATQPRQLPAAAVQPSGRIRGTAVLNGELALYLSAAQLVSDTSEPEAAFPPAALWQVSPPAADQQRLLCFSEPGGDTSMMFGFTLRQVVEIAQGLRVIRVAAGSPCTIGITEWRGFVVPVIDPGALLGVSQASSDLTRARFAILRGTRTNQLFALPATEFTSLSLPIGSDDSVTPLPGLGRYVRAAYEMLDGCLVLPDLDEIAQAA